MTLSPNTRVTIDEIGVILPNDNDASASDIPGIYWNAAGSFYAYIFCRLSTLGIDVLGESQLIGYPALPFLDPQFPSVALLNWLNGEGTARYWVLKLLVDNLKLGDNMIVTAPTPMAEFCGQVLGGSNLTLECQTGFISKITFASYGTPAGNCGSFTSGTCEASQSKNIVSTECFGQQSCTVFADPSLFGEDPCVGYIKTLYVSAQCSIGTGSAPWSSQLYYAQTFSSATTGMPYTLVLSKNVQPMNLFFSGLTGQRVTYIDESTGFGPPASFIATSETLELLPFGVVLITVDK